MVFVGIDVGKQELVVALCDAKGESLGKAFSVPNSATGYAKLQRTLQSRGDEEIHLCMESTGIYGEQAAAALHGSAGVTVSIVNPARINAYARAQLKRTKTDRVDALLIAQYAASQRPAAWKPEADAVRELRELVRHRDALVNDLTRLNNRLEKCQHSAAPAAAVVKSLKQMARQTERQILAMDAACRTLVKQDSAMKEDQARLTSVPGIGEVSALKLMAELGNVEGRSVKQVVAHSGLSPKERTSGISVRGRSRISKIGNHHLRTALYFPAMVACRFNPVIKAFYEKLVVAGKPKKVALIAVMRKLLHLAYGILKNKTVFNPKLHMKTA